MNTHKQITEQLLNYPLHTSLLAIASLLLVCSAYVKPPITIALILLGTVVYTVLFFGTRLSGVLPPSCKQGESES